ncbi:MAG: hypothetical protein ABGZ35_18940 [Planctomycetaceae bacterium]
MQHWLLLFIAIEPLTAFAQAPCPSLGADVLQYSRHPTPVLTAGTESWEAGGVLHVAVCQADGVFYMYYTALAKPGYAYRSIGLATSTNGINWQRKPTAVLAKGPAHEFDDVHVHMPSVLYDAGSKQFRMWYVGYQNNRGNTIGYAESSDGISWNKKGQVLSFGGPNTFDCGSLREPSVLYDPKTKLFKLWYNGTLPNQHYGPTGYAVSEDGINWGRVNTINGDQERFIGIHVVRLDDCYHGWYGTGPDIGYAHSVDGLRWAWPKPEVVLTRGTTFDSRYLQAPVVIVDRAANKIRVWYNGAQGTDEVLTVGYAEATLK